MGLTSAMLVGYTGIKSNQYTMDTVGDNVANVNTTAFKNQRALFETVYYRTLDPGSGPDANTGGTNPKEVGYGSRLAALQRSFEPGNIQGTGVKSDLAVDGDGFFIVQNADQDQLYTRDGSFELNEHNELVTQGGFYLLGFPADASGAITPGALGTLTIPLGTESRAVATTAAVMDGNLDAAATVATTGAVLQSAPLATANGSAASGTRLVDLVDEDGLPRFAEGDVITLRNVQKGGADLPERRFVVGTDGTTLGDFAGFLQNMLAIDPATATPSGQTPGVTVNESGALVVTSNAGEPNAISIDAADIRNDTSGILPFSFTATPASGEGVSTAFIVYDSLGNPLEVRLRAAVERRDETGAVWRFFAESADDTDPTPLIGTGTLTFDQNGQLVASTGTNLTIDVNENGSTTPVTFALDVSNVTGLNFGGGTSSLVLATQDGRAGGTLIDYAVDADGKIVGTFSNGVTQDFGQVALAVFRNPEGLQARSDNLFAVGVNSGAAIVTAPNVQGAGSIQSAALEMSNVELAREFINLISASTGFSAASRVVRSADDMLQELLLLAR